MGWDVLLVDTEGFSLWGGSPFTAQMLLSYIRKLAKPKPVGTGNSIFLLQVFA